MDTVSATLRYISIRCHCWLVDVKGIQSVKKPRATDQQGLLAGQVKEEIDGEPLAMIHLKNSGDGGRYNRCFLR